MKEVIEKINNVIKSYVFLDVYIYKMDRYNLILVGSQDFSYYHNMEIHFINVFSVISNAFYSVNTNSTFISLLEDGDELKEINLKYGIEIGNKVFKMISEEGKEFLIVAEKIHFFHKNVKYD